MDELTTILTETLFGALANSTANIETLANQALKSGIDKYQKEDYKGAAIDFKRSLGLAPYSENAVNTVKYLAQSYLRLDDTEKAIGAYKDFLKVNPNMDEVHGALGNLYLAENRISEAVDAYEKAVRLYDDANNRFALGQGYLKAQRYEDAEQQFKNVIKMTPKSANGYFGLGQAYAGQKKYTEAIQELERAVTKKKDLWAAYAEIGFTYADAGQLDKAKEMQSFLENRDDGLAQTLAQAIQKATRPRIMHALGESTFQYFLTRKTPVRVLGSYLKQADSSQDLSMVFQFNKAMDRDSVENPLNWTIKRSAGNGPGMDYNNGLPVPDTEVRISPIPVSVYWNEKEMTATVRFTIRQNSTVNATIDPTHIEFAFKGRDADGNLMDPKYDQYMGFSGHF